MSCTTSLIIKTESLLRREATFTAYFVRPINPSFCPVRLWQQLSRWTLSLLLGAIIQSKFLLTSSLTHTVTPLISSRLQHCPIWLLSNMSESRISFNLHTKSDLDIRTHLVLLNILDVLGIEPALRTHVALDDPVVGLAQLHLVRVLVRKQLGLGDEALVAQQTGVFVRASRVPLQRFGGKLVATQRARGNWGGQRLRWLSLATSSSFVLVFTGRCFLFWWRWRCFSQCKGN